MIEVKSEDVSVHVAFRRYLFNSHSLSDGSMAIVVLGKCKQNERLWA